MKQLCDTSLVPVIQVSSDTIYPEIDLTGCLIRQPPLQMPMATLGCHLCFWPTGYKLGAPMSPSLGSINFPEQFEDLRETLYFLDYPFIIKEYNSGMAKWEICMGPVTWKEAAEPSCPLWACHSWLHYVCICDHMQNHWLSLIDLTFSSSALSRGQAGDSGSFISLTTRLVPPATSPYLYNILGLSKHLAH